METTMERKFLIKSDDWRSLIVPHLTCTIVQSYLSIKPEISVSLTSSVGHLRVVGTLLNGERQVFEHEIPAADAIAMQRIGKFQIQKTRHEVWLNRQTWYIDEFHGRLAGMTMAGIKAAPGLSLPEWIGQEVTTDPDFCDVFLAQSCGESFHESCF